MKKILLLIPFLISSISLTPDQIIKIKQDFDDASMVSTIRVYCSYMYSSGCNLLIPEKKLEVIKAIEAWNGKQIRPDLLNKLGL